MSDARDGWRTGATYEGFMGRWSRQLAPAFVSWIEAPDGAHWLDVGCGTGALTVAICDQTNPASVLAVDPAAAFVDYANQHSGRPQATFAVAGAGSLPPRPDGYGCVSSLLALNFFPDQPAAVREMTGLVRRGGAVAACVWDYAGKMEFLRHFWDAAVERNPAARALDEGTRFPICDRPALTELFRGSSLADVACEAIDTPTRFESFDDYWQPLLGATGPAASYVASLEEEERDALAAWLAQRLPRSQDGSIELVARAWAVRGTVT